MNPTSFGQLSQMQGHQLLLHLILRLLLQHLQGRTYSPHRVAPGRPAPQAGFYKSPPALQGHFGQSGIGQYGNPNVGGWNGLRGSTMMTPPTIDGPYRLGGLQ